MVHYQLSKYLDNYMRRVCKKWVVPFLMGCVVVYVFFMLKNDDWQKHHDQAVSALQELRYHDVVKSCDEAIKLNANHSKAYAIYTKKAKALNKLYDYNAAIEAADKAIEINPKYEEAYLAKVDALFMLNKDDELANVLEEIVILNPHTTLKGLLNTIRHEKGKWCY